MTRKTSTDPIYHKVVKYLEAPVTPLGVSEFLPKHARDKLVNAAQYARMMPADSFERRSIIDKAIFHVKRYYPEYFKDK